MSTVNENIVREYFESLGFVVSCPCKYVTPGQKKKSEEELDLVVVNPRAKEHKTPESVIWTTEDLKSVSRGVVAIRGWHTGRFYMSRLEKDSDVLRFAEEGPYKSACDRLRSSEVAKILCLAELPASQDLKKRTVETLKAKGIDGILVFRTILDHLISFVDKKRNYEKSELLQTIRILKSYDLLRDNQMELFGKKRRSTRAKGR